VSVIRGAINTGRAGWQARCVTVTVSADNLSELRVLTSTTQGGQRGVRRGCWCAQPPLRAARIVVLSDAYFGATIFVKVIVSPVRSPLTMTRSPANVFRSARS